MNNKTKYPMEAFALAMVLFSSGMKSAMLVGVTLIFGDVLLGLLSDVLGEKSVYAASVIGAAVSCAALYGMYYFTGMTPEMKEIAGFAAAAVLLGKHNVDRVKSGEENDYGVILTGGACAYAVFVIVAVIREYLAGASIFEMELPKAVFGAAAFGKPMFALICAGIGVALVNRIIKAESAEDAALWVCIPAIVIETPFIWNNVPELVGIIVGVVMTGVIYLTFRKKLLFSDTKKYIEGIPAEMVTLGMIYMIATLL